MFDRKAHIEMLKSALKDWSDEKIEKHADDMERRYAKVKDGDNVLHIRHSIAIVDDNDLRVLEKELAKLNYELSSFDTSGQMMAAARDFISDVVLYLNQPIVRETILLGLGTNALWDGIKAIIRFLHSRARSRTTKTMTKDTLTERTTTMTISVEIKKNVRLELPIEGIDVNQIEKASEAIRTSAPKWESNESMHPKVAIYNKDKNTWEVVDYSSEMLKRRSTVLRTLPLQDYINELEAQENRRSKGA